MSGNRSAFAKFSTSLAVGGWPLMITSLPFSVLLSCSSFVISPEIKMSESVAQKLPDSIRPLN
jgi:hypothetical protein